MSLLWAFLPSNQIFRQLNHTLLLTSPLKAVCHADCVNVEQKVCLNKVIYYYNILRD